MSRISLINKIPVSKTIIVPEVGDVLLKKSKQSKRLSIKVSIDGKVRVNLPLLLSFKHAESFILQKKDWIIRSKQKMVERFGVRNNSYVSDCENITMFHHLKIKTGEQGKINTTVSGGIITITHPLDLNVENPQVQEAIKKGILFAMKNEAKNYLPKRLHELSIIHGLQYNRVLIKDTVSRWGSCSSRNNINLSLRLMKLPEYLIDYVILHELAHTVHKNHGKQFWLFLGDLCNQSKSYAKEMKKYSTSI